MTKRFRENGLQAARVLHDLVGNEILPGPDLSAEVGFSNTLSGRIEDVMGLPRFTL